MNSLDKFVKQVTDTINDNHNQEGSDASFIFGISGKWGEGKTTFLKRLKPELENKGFDVAIINPWKFASDKVSFLRSFLKELSKSTSKKITKWEKFRNLINNKDSFRQLDHDITDTKVHFGYLIITILWLTLILLLYFNSPIFLGLIPTFIKNTFATYLNLITFLISSSVIIALISAIAKTILIQRSNKAITTVDQFDRLLKDVLVESRSDKICVFVDDLDRVTPEVARIVLDNLRTFFDTPQLSFVVTGDHTVLERYIGEQTLPHKSESEQLEEGRRFLKKIFDVYWRLPRPILKDFQEALHDIYEQRKEKLSLIFKTNEDKQKLLNYLTNYFDKNYREVIRFLDKVIFTFQIINTQLSHASKETKKYYQEMYKKPLLVVRILMFEELCSPFFEEVVRDAQVLKDLERAVVRKDESTLASLIDKFNKDSIDEKITKLSPSQYRFLKRFIKEDPTFYKGKNWDVYSITPFISLAADAGLGDERGSLPEDFIEELKLRDPELIRTSIDNSGPENLSKVARATFEYIQGGIPQLPERVESLRTIFTALRLLPGGHSAHLTFLEWFKNYNFTPYQSADSGTRITCYIIFWQWLDVQEHIPQDYINLFPFVNSSDFSMIDVSQKYGSFSTMVLCQWLKAFYESNTNAGLNSMQTILPSLLKEKAREEMESIVDELVEHFLTDGGEANREARYLILTEYTKTGRQKLKSAVLDKIKKLDENMWNWATGKMEAKFVTKEEMERKIYDNLNDGLNADSLLSVIRFGDGKFSEIKDGYWERVVHDYSHVMVDILHILASEAHSSLYAPRKDRALQVFESVLKRIQTIEDINFKNHLILSLKKDWFWANLGDEPKVGEKLKKLYKEEKDVSLKASITQILQSWNITIEDTPQD